MKTKLLLLFLVLTFFANAQVTLGLLHEFKFNNSYNNEAGNQNFTSNASTSFVSDRNGNTNSAVQISNTTIQTTLVGLPIGAAARTVSFWYKTNTTISYPNVFSYGINTVNRMFGMYHNVSGMPVFFCNTGDIASTGNGIPNNTWNHAAITYNGSQVVVYINGIIVINGSIALNTGNSAFLLGHASSTTTTIDDLKIYNRAITQTEVQALYNGALPPAIAEYNFNNTLENVNGTNPFSVGANNSFVADRNGNANSALYINNYISATIPNLPYGNLIPASVSVWVKMTNSGGGYIYTYGLSPNASSGFINSTEIIAFGPGGNFALNNLSNNVNEWYHLVFTYDGQASRIYRNGTLLGAWDRNWNIVNNNNLFSLGKFPGSDTNYFEGNVDDLKIYPYALSQTEINNLYTNNSLSSQDFNQSNLEVFLYPNPANDVLNIEMIKEVKSLEIYNLQGQKIKSAIQKQINVSDLAKGIYLVKVSDIENATTTKRIIIQK